MSPREAQEVGGEVGRKGAGIGRAGRETAAHGVHGRTVGAAEAGVHRKSLLDRAAPAGAGKSATSERKSDQNMVPGMRSSSSHA